MDATKFLGQLIELRNELAETSPFPWSNIGEWASKAIPIIKVSLPVFYEDFQRHLEPPKAPQLPRVGGNDAFNRQMAAQEALSYKASALSAKQRLLNFLDSILKTATTAAPGELDDFGILYRKDVFERDLKRLSEEASRNGDPLVLVMADLDHFKQVNDTHGHPKGDEVMKEWFEIIKRKVKGKGEAYRWGGDEVAILLPNYSIEEALPLAEAIRQNVEVSDISREFGVTGSLGVACMPLNAVDGKSLKEAADQALYKAKEAGRNRVVFASEVKDSI